MSRKRWVIAGLVLSCAAGIGCDEEEKTLETTRNVRSTSSGTEHRKSTNKPRPRLTKPVGALNDDGTRVSEDDGPEVETPEPAATRLGAARERTATAAPPPGPQASATSVVVAKRDGARAKVDPQADVATTSNEDGMRLRAAVKVDGAALVLDLVVTNGTSGTVFVYAPLGSYDFTKQSWGPSAARVYSRFLRSGVLDLSKRLVPLPKKRLVYRPEVPYLTRLESGAQLRETIRIPLPFKLDHPYTDKAGPTQAVSRGVAVSIGYATDLKAGDLKQVGEDRYEVTYPKARRAQKVLQGAVQPIRIRVRR